MQCRILAIIPARYHSQRFPGKPLVELAGKTMLQRVYEQVQKAEKITDIYIATEDERIVKHAESFGAQAILTSSSHQSGTERLLEVFKRVRVYNYYLNVQGDEPLLVPEQLEQLLELLFAIPEELAIATLCQKIDSWEEINNPNVVKVVKDNNSKALYFSRGPIPYLREEKRFNTKGVPYFKHIGLYGFSYAALKHIAQLGPHPLEIAEKLEQLRWLAHGVPIYIQETNYPTIAVDTPEDALKVISLLKKSKD
ncbi:MAG: 3-deoxy-manno-octulosonate cytidylyltransferase [Bacteroidia bacterium]|nr:3-deoxy-manno-octulosonate cytidylyltransferase [Bacteroidia bacterium]